MTLWRHLCWACTFESSRSIYFLQIFIDSEDGLLTVKSYLLFCEG